MKVSISLPDEDVEFLDAYAASEGFASRSAVVHRAIRLLHSSGLGLAYEEAFADWEKTGAAGEWESTTADGLRSDAAR
jgi:Arc/MetJ-type ribon-helix-helix transcriptional regulator